MKRGDYTEKVKAALTAKLDVLNISGLERACKFPKNKIRKWLRDEHEPTAEEAHRVAKCVNDLGFEFSGLNMAANDIRRMPY